MSYFHDMETDLVRALGYANLDTRLKRISDTMSHSLRAMYRNMQLDTEPNWYLVFWILREHPNISVTEIALRLRFTHQSVVNMTNKMVQKGYLTPKKDATDKRKTIFELTSKAVAKFPLFTQIWEVGKTVTLELLNKNLEIMGHLEILEKNLEEASFGQRITDKLNNIHQ